MISKSIENIIKYSYFEIKIKKNYIHKLLYNRLDNYINIVLKQNLKINSLYNFEEGVFVELNNMNVIGLVPTNSDSIYFSISQPFQIKDFTFEKDTSGDELNLIVWICKTKDGNEFSVRPKGTHDERKSLYKECIEGNFQKYKGKNLWVKYFELTDRNIPRFPTTKTENVDSYIRDIIE